MTGAGRHEVAVRWHLPPATDIRLADGGASVSTSAGKFAVTVAGTAPFRLEFESGPDGLRLPADRGRTGPYLPGATGPAAAADHQLAPDC